MTTEPGGEVDDVLVIRAAGEIDKLAAARLSEALGESIEQMTGGLVILDLNEVTFLGSVGLAALAEAATQANERGTLLRIVVDCGNTAVLRPIELTGLDTLLAIYRNVPEALDRGPAGRDEAGGAP